MPEDPSVDPQRTVHYVPTPDTASTVDDTGACRPASSTEPHLSAPPVDAPSVPGYRITAEIARGGMGRVYAGHDLTLDREVAIKTLLGGADADRFVTEAKITARLPHPGIPPVHALGTLADGTPYLAMKLIRGHTLAELLQKRSSPLDGLPRFVQIFEQIAQAVGFAHAHGVIHRDLKPLNVMVGALGEVQVMDWGLAKHLASGEHQRPEQLPEDENVTQTAAGTILGTPGYMAPEQARGEVVDVRADVFSLGATLAVILTGQPAIVGASKREVIEKAARADLADVRKRLTNSGADGELIELALSCLSADVAQRPVDGRAVAALVAAYWVGVEARLKQAETERTEALVREAEQRKRRRTVQVAAGVIAVVLLAGLGVSLWQMFRAVDAEGQANRNLKAEQQARADETMARQQAVLSEQRAVQERAATEVARRRTRQALDEMSSQVIEDWLSRRGQLEPAQRAFLVKALNYYEDFAQESGSSEEARAAVADANLRVANMRSRLGQHSEAETAYRRAVDLYANLAEKIPTVPEYRHKLAGSCTSLGHLLTDTGRALEAESAYRKALAIRRQLVVDFPKVPEYRQALGASHNNLGILFKDTGRSREAESAYREALAIRQKLAAEYPTVPQYRQQLGAIQNNLGLLLADTGQPAKAKSAYGDALKVQKQLAADFTTIPQFRVELARSYNGLGSVLTDTGHVEEAQSSYRDALTIQKGLAADFPAIPQYRQELAATHKNLGSCCRAPVDRRQSLSTEMP
jgi:serine/threonine protein kinase